MNLDDNSLDSANARKMSKIPRLIDKTNISELCTLKTAINDSREMSLPQHLGAYLSSILLKIAS